MSLVEMTLVNPSLAAFKKELICGSYISAGVHYALNPYQYCIISFPYTQTLSECLQMKVGHCGCDQQDVNPLDMPPSPIPSETQPEVFSSSHSYFLCMGFAVKLMHEKVFMIFYL